MHTRYIDLNVLQYFPASCLNRGAYNIPKSLMIGNTRRSTFSAQKQRRDVRLELDDVRDEPAARTRNLPPRVAAALRAAGWPDELADFAAGQVAYSAIPGGMATNADQHHRTQAMLLLPARGSVEGLVRLCTEHRTVLEKALAGCDEGPAKARAKGSRARKDDVPALLPPAEVAAVLTARTATINLFGRMLAGLDGADVTSAVQTAPAYTTHTSDLQEDYVLAQETWPNAGDKGGAFLDTAYLTTGVFYRYSTVNLTDLIQNLDGDLTEALDLLAAYTHAFIQHVPQAKWSSTAPHTLPALVHYAVRDSRPLSYSAAFEQPIPPERTGGFLASSLRALDEEAGEYDQLFGAEHRIGHGHATIRYTAQHLGPRHPSFAALVAACRQDADPTPTPAVEAA
ncbi:type I-E CRISPR-associated protein Cas7/Cse4/CasC [Streptomyces sp. NPDC102364]|uniref:type I-E CRISPR-associated protein Cas7/Cse4/CasC n=1 Tax=Streptomyces sp. NPDC102364 TaxID=3366161 RepID=UPI00381F3910